MTRAAEYWQGVEEPARRAAELAWQSYTAGSIPVGAVLTDAEGTSVAEARNRAFEDDSPSGQLADTYIAHAEINVLASLPPGEYGDHTLWTSLAPCFLCSTAIAHSHVGSVRFAAADPLMVGTERLPELNAWLASRWPRRHGPRHDALARLCGLLHAAWFAERQPEGVVASAYAGVDPQTLALARSVTDTRRLRTATSVTDALERLWPEMSG